MNVDFVLLNRLVKKDNYYIDTPLCMTWKDV